MQNMFCFQCEQTVGGKGCTSMGACGKVPEVSNKQDELIVALIHLAKDVLKNGATSKTDKVILDGLFTTVTNVSFDEASIDRLISKINTLHSDNSELCGLWEGDKNIVSLRSTLLFGIKGMAAYAHHAYVLGKQSREVTDWFYKGMAALLDEHSIDEWLSLIMEFGGVNLKCMALLDEANTGTYGNPVPTQVTTNIEKGPFVVITGHDLHDLAMLLEQTEGKGVNVYTHSEMLPAHAYPELKKYTHLKGNFGTAWQNQQKEFNNIPAPVLFTTNCLMPPKESYKDRVFTTSVVAYPEMKHVSENADGTKDFSELINKAIELGGYQENLSMTGINGGSTLTTGFGHHTVLSVADKIVDAVKSGAIRHFFLVGGCDGAKPGRNYYTDFVSKTPKDTVILTLACGKFRFNDMDAGEIGGLPRILDMGQCNDAYSAIQVAAALSKVFECGVNELPLTLVLSWYEQKAVCILLTLLSLGIKNIYIGPSLPAFLSDDVLAVLVDKFGLKPITDPDTDLKAILG